MKSELKETSPTTREIRVEIAPELVKQSYNKVSQKYASRASVPGFRKGYAPLDVIRLRFKEEIKSEVLQDVVPSQIAEAIAEHNLNPLAEPHLHLDDQENVKVNGSEPLKLHVHVEVMPEISTPKYEGIEVTRRVRPVEDGQVEDLIAERLQREAALIPVEGRASEIGDTVIADLEGTFDGHPDGDPIKADDLEIKLGDEVIEQSFTDNLMGVREDEEKKFTVAYAENFSSEALAGKTVHYKVKIKSVGKMETPEMNDDWAVSLDEGYESLADLRKKVRADLEAHAKLDADARLRNSAIAKLIEDNAFDVPNALLENQSRNLLNDFARDMQSRGVDLAKVESQFVEMAYQNMRQQAERDVRGALLLDKIADAEKLEVSDGEVDDEITKMAEFYRSTPEEVRESIEKQGDSTDGIRNNLKTRKSIEAIIAKAKVTDGEWIDETLAPGEPAEEKKLKKKASAKTKAGTKPDGEAATKEAKPPKKAKVKDA